MDSSTGSRPGTVADRIRAYQDVETLASKAHTSGLAPRVLSVAREPGTLTSHGRRKDSSFASPAGRASRDGNEGLRGDGRPPVGSGTSEGSMFRRDEPTSCDAPPSNVIRPPTRLALSSSHQPAPRPSTERAVRTRSKTRSSIEIEDPTHEITAARSRLRNVVEVFPRSDEPKRERSGTLAELEHMLDDAINDQVEVPPAPSVADTSDVSPVSEGPQIQPLPDELGIRPSRATGASHARSDPVQPHTVEELCLPRRDSPVHGPDDISSAIVLAPGCGGGHEGSERAHSARHVDPSIDRQLSPVRQKAAMFERLGRQSSEPQGLCQHPVREDRTLVIERSRDGTKRTARIQIGGTGEERPATPLIPLTLPAMVGKDRGGSRSPLGSNPSINKGTADTAPPADALNSADGPRKPSVNWPFRWHLFNKSPPAPTQETTPVFTTDEAKDEHYPVTGPSVARSKVQDLLHAANEKDLAEHRRRHSERERFNRRQTRATAAAAPSFLEADQDDAPSEPRTPLSQAMTEKQVLSPPSEPEGSEGGCRKAVPHTPVRGRSKMSVHRLSMGDQQHTVEQHFNLSPGLIRSGSRASRGGVKVEVEVRDSPERDARDRGEKVVTIRANVAAGDNE